MYSQPPPAGCSLQYILIPSMSLVQWLSFLNARMSLDRPWLGLLSTLTDSTICQPALQHQGTGGDGNFDASLVIFLQAQQLTPMLHSRQGTRHTPGTPLISTPSQAHTCLLPNPLAMEPTEGSRRHTMHCHSSLARYTLLLADPTCSLTLPRPICMQDLRPTVSSGLVSPFGNLVASK